MTFARTLPQRDPAYDAYRAKISVLQILRERGYNLGNDAKMLDTQVRMRDAYEAFKKQVYAEYEKESRTQPKREPGMPSDAKYVHPQGTMSPLRVIFTASTSVSSRLAGIIEDNKTPQRRAPVTLHLLFVVDKPREVTSVEARTIGNNTIEILSYQRLLVNPLTHFRSPIRTEKLSRRERDTMLKNTEGKILPGLLPTDPVILFLNMGPRDIVRTVDAKVYTSQNASSIGYRIAPRAVVCSSEGCEEPSHTFRSRYCVNCAP